MTHHFGVLIPSTNTTVEAELARLPLGYQAHYARLLSNTPGRPFAASRNEDIDYQSKLLGTAKVEMLILIQTSASVFEDDYDEKVMRRMSAAAGGVPAITSAYAMGRALRALGAKRIGLVSPYSEEVNARTRRYFSSKHGLEIAALEGFAASDSYSIGRLGPENARDAFTRIDRPEIDAFAVPGANFATMGSIPAWEVEFNKPVVSSTQAALWAMMRQLGGEAAPGFGRLLEQMPQHLADKIIDIVRLDINAPERDVLTRTLEALRGHDAATDSERVEALIGAWRANGLGVVGPEACLEALEMGQVEELLITATPSMLKQPESLRAPVAPGPVEVDTSAPVAETDANQFKMADELVTKAQQTSARVRFIEDTSLLADVGGVGDAVEICLDRVGLEVRAVVELDAPLELDRVDESVLAHLVAVREHGNELHVLVEPEHAFVEGLGHRLRQRVVRVVGVGGGERRRHGEHDVLGGEGRCRHRGKRDNASKGAISESHK